MPVKGMSEAIGFPRTRVPLLVLIGGLTGCLGGFLWLTIMIGLTMADVLSRGLAASSGVH
jgi:hypothetical protein